MLNKYPLITLGIFIEVSAHCNKKLLKHTSPTVLLIIGKYILNTALLHQVLIGTVIRRDDYLVFAASCSLIICFQIKIYVQMWKHETVDY